MVVIISLFKLPQNILSKRQENKNEKSLKKNSMYNEFSKVLFKL